MASNRRNRWERLSRAISRPAIAISTLGFLVILNVAVIAQGLTAEANVPDLSEMASTDDLRASTSFYDIENNQP